MAIPATRVIPSTFAAVLVAPRRPLPGLDQALGNTSPEIRNLIVLAFNQGSDRSGPFSRAGYFDPAALARIGDGLLANPTAEGVSAARALHGWLVRNHGFATTMGAHGLQQRIASVEAQVANPAIANVQIPGFRAAFAGVAPEPTKRVLEAYRASHGALDRPTIRKLFEDLQAMPGGDKAIGATVAWAQRQVGWPAEDLAWMSAAASNRHVRLTLVRPVESPVLRDPAYEARAAQAMRDEAHAALTRALARANGDPSERQSLLGGAASRPHWEVRDLARQLEAGLTPREAGRATDQAAALAKRMQSERLQDPMIRWLNSPRPDPLKGGVASDPMTDQIFFEQARRQLGGS